VSRVLKVDSCDMVLFPVSIGVRVSSVLKVDSCDSSSAVSIECFS